MALRTGDDTRSTALSTSCGQTCDQGKPDGKRGEAGNLESVRRVNGWMRNLAPPIFADGSHGRMAAELLDGRRVLLTGTPVTTGHLDVPAGVSTYTEGHYPRIAGDGGGEVSWAAQWFGPGDYSPTTAAQVWEAVETTLQREWRDESARLYGTPSTTGRDLWARCIGDGEAWPVLPAELQDIVRASAGQGRMETFQRGAEALPMLYEYDARMAYAALLRNLPVGEPVQVARRNIEAWQQAHPYSEGRYRVTWKAPEGWKWPGLLPTHSGAGALRAWEWPRSSDVPSWCGGAELWVALQHGWTVRYHDAWVWPKSGDPLRKWQSRLLRVLANLSNELEASEQRAMARQAVRAILLHTIGAFHGSPRKVSHSGVKPPDDALGIRVIRRRPGAPPLWAWYTLEAPAWPEMVHPEWSATVWGRARARLAYSHRGEAGFLTLPPGAVVALRTDAIYTTEPTGWTDDNGDPGHYTLRGVYPGPHAWPRNGLDVLKIAGRR